MEEAGTGVRLFSGALYKVCAKEDCQKLFSWQEEKCPKCQNPNYTWVQLKLLGEGGENGARKES